MGNRAANPWKSAPRAIAAAACAAAGLVVFQCFGNAVRGYVDTSSLFWWWISQWIDPGAETQHGWLILAIALGVLGWNLRKVESLELGAESRSSAGVPPAMGKDGRRDACATWPAAVALLGGLALHAVGFAAQQTRVSIVAFLLFAWGVLRLGGGRRWGAAAAFPLGFLVFSIPINVLDSIGFWLQMGVVRATAAIAHVAGIEVVRNGTQLFAPDGRYQYDVVAACSGVRSLVALTALSVLAGYISFRGGLRRAIVLLLCFPLVYLGNVARLTAIVFAAEAGGQRWGDLAHEAMGVGVFVIVLGGVIAAVLAMERWWPEQELPNAECRWPGSGPPQSASANRQPAIIAAAVVAVAVGEMFLLHHLAHAPARGGAGVALAANGVDPVELPGFIGTEWVGRRTEVTPIEREILPADTGFSRRVYVPVAEPTKAVLLSLVLSGRDRTSIHRPELCLVGQGWTIEGRATHAFRYPDGSDTRFPATVLRVRREVTTPGAAGKPGRQVSVPQLVAYWFVSADRVVATHWDRVALDAWNRVLHARADRWAYVLMQTDAADGEAAALARMQAVLDGTLEVFAPQKPHF